VRWKEIDDMCNRLDTISEIGTDGRTDAQLNSSLFSRRGHPHSGDWLLADCFLCPKPTVCCAVTVAVGLRLVICASFVSNSMENWGVHLIQ